MAKLALINKQHKREKLVAQYAKKRETIKAKMSVNATPDERMDAMKKLAKLPRNSNPTRLHNRCSVTGRARGYSRLFGLCRQQLRTMASEGKLPGVRKSSW
ncbi:MAG: 30S ribosomal protein S14 [Alphaproteobacteria bacterium]